MINTLRTQTLRTPNKLITLRQLSTTIPTLTNLTPNPMILRIQTQPPQQITTITTTINKTPQQKPKPNLDHFLSFSTTWLIQSTHQSDHKSH